MHIHVFTTESPYSDSFIRIIMNGLDINKHLFIFNKTAKPRYRYSENISRRIIYAGNIRKFFLTFTGTFRKCDKVIFHYLPYGPSLFTWYLSPSLLRKSVWIIWGGDIMPAKDFRKSLLPRIYESLRRRIIVKIPRIATLIRDDFETVSRIYGTNAVFSQVFYPYPIDLQGLAELKKNVPDHPGKNILLGNSGSPSNNHIEALERLAHYKGLEIRIICPLSYGGTEEYIDSVIRKGHELFGEKFVPLKEFIDPEAYSLLLYNTDIAVMNHDRQQGMGNIFPLLFIGRKVYMKSGTTSYNFLKSLGCVIFVTQDIGLDDSLLDTGIGALKYNEEIIEELISTDNCRHLWNNLLNSI